MQRDEYRKMAEVEDEMWYYRALHHHVISSLKKLPSVDVRILDAGCGTGGLIRRMKSFRPKWGIDGLDFSSIACELARDRTGSDITEGSIESLPFADESFHAVVSCDVVCQVHHPAKALKEMSRCLKPGGLVVLTMPAYQWMYSYHDREVANLRRYSRTQVSHLLEETGFQVLSSTYWNTLLFPLAVIRRKILRAPSNGSDVKLFPPLFEKTFGSLMALEHAWRRCGGRMPFGNSVLTVARKLSQDVSLQLS